MDDFKLVVDEMVHSLIDAAEYEGIDLSDLTINNFNELLDERFNDGGETRCEQFTDLAIDYALEYGEIESMPFLDAQWKSIEEAIKRVAHYFNHKEETI